MVVSYRIALPVAQSPLKRVLHEQRPYNLHHVGLYVAGLLGYLVNEGVAELLRLGEDRSVDSASAFQVLFRVVIQWQGAHGQPYYFIAVLADSFHEVRVSDVEVIPVNHVVDVSSDVTHSGSSVDIAHHEPVISCVKVHFCLQLGLAHLVNNLIHSELQVHLSQLLVGEGPRHDVAFFVKGEDDLRDKFFVDVALDGSAIVSETVGSETGQEGGGSVRAIFLSDYDCVADSCEDGVVLEGAG